MIALALALSLAAAGGPDGTDLPRSLGIDESPYLVAPAAKDELSWWIGGHLGIAGAYDADNPCLVLGVNGRAHVLEWLGFDATIDVQTKQKVEDRVSIFQVPFEAAALFYPPLELPVRPYGIFGVGFTITDVTLPGNDKTDRNLLWFLGFGAEFELQPNVLLDANLRFVFATDPPNTGDFSADWAQFTVGLLIKLSK